MRDILIDLDSIDVKSLYDDTVIRQGENNASQLVITLNEEFTGYQYLLNFQLNHEVPYNSQEVTPVDGVITFPLINTLTFASGNLKCELQAYDVNNTLVKSAVFVFRIIPAITGTPIILPPEYAAFLDLGEPESTDVALTLVKRDADKKFGITTIDFSSGSLLTQLVAGRLQWDDVYKCLVYGLEGGVGSHQIGQEVNIYARNVDGSLPVGTPVYLAGSTGELPSINKATNNGTEQQARVIGVAGGATGIGSNSNGYVLAYGVLHNYDTNAYNLGDELWLGVNGAITNVKPSLPAYQVFIGWVIKKSGSGKIFINPKYSII